MRVSQRQTYEAGPDRVWAMLTDPAYRQEVCAATGALSYEVDSDADDAGGTVRVSRALPAPDHKAVRKLVGDTVTVEQTETWGPAEEDGTRRAELRLQVKGQPATMTGASTLAPDGSGSALEIEAELKVRIPLVGGSLEKELAAAVTAGLAQELEVGRRYLS